MGCLLAADCSCGYHATAEVGAGLETLLTECFFPFHCPSCRSLVDADTMAATPTCPQCGSTQIVSYSDPALAGQPGTAEVAAWNLAGDLSRPLSLSDGTYWCPACAQTRLRFTLVGLFD